ncbi:MAG: HAMP domain-containing histidine kinase [Anaerolineae bacterium]|nr:HAMP domain-containing histidine kinase [Anaerolineae bacterium]
MPNSIQHRLPLSYVAVALTAVLCVASVLLVILNAFYTAQERAYLERNAVAVSEILSSLVVSNAGQTRLQAQVNAFSFLTQARVQLLDSDERIVADSGPPQSHNAVASATLKVQLDDTIQSFSQTVGEGNFTTLLAIEDTQGGISQETSVTASADSAALPDSVTGIVGPLALIEESYGLNSAESTRSTQIVTYALPEQQGTVRLSEGPAYGRAVLRSVAWGLAVAGVVAVALAALVGFVASRRLIRPLLALTAVTEQMAAGDLSARAAIRRQDEIGQLGATFNTMAERIEKMVTTLRQFVADAAHELHTPLTALRTNLELASDSAESNAYIGAAQRQVAQLQRLNDDLLSLSRLENSAETAPRDSVDLTELVRVRSEFYAAQAEQNDLTFTLTCLETPVTINGSASQLQQVFDNLVSNAIKFTPPGGTITVSLSQLENTAKLVVTDTGMGIVPDDIDLIFGRFYRGRNSGSFPGSGLGLAIAAAITAAHDGEISAESQPGNTRFTITLPLEK